MPPSQETYVLFQIIVLDFTVSAHENENHVVQFDCCSIYNVQSLSPVALHSLSGKAGKGFKLQGSFRWILLSCQLLFPGGFKHCACSLKDSVTGT